MIYVPQDAQIIWEGRHHTVYVWDNKDKVIKIPKVGYPVDYKQANTSLDFFQKTFPEFIPDTHIILWDKDIPYHVVQDRVHGILLGEFLRKQWMSQRVGNQLMVFTERALEILDKKTACFDIIGTPSSDELKNQWEGCTNIIVSWNQQISFVDLCCQSRSIWRPVLLNKVIKLIRRDKYRQIILDRRALLMDLKNRLRKCKK